MVPYTVTETFNNRSRGYTVWADDFLTLKPHANRSYELDLIWSNGSMVYVKVEESTNSTFLNIVGFRGYGYGGGNNSILIKQYISSRTWPESPFEYFWAPPTLAAWDFVFENPHDTVTNFTVKIVCYHYNVEWQEKVTLHAPVIDSSFAYVGIVVIFVGIVLNLYYARRCKRKVETHTSQ